MYDVFIDKDVKIGPVLGGGAEHWNINTWKLETIKNLTFLLSRM